MPKLYEYFGLIVLFYSNEHEPVHVHGIYQDRESKAELIVVGGRVVRIRFIDVDGRLPLRGRHLADFKKLVQLRANDIVRKWIDYFVMHRAVKSEKITKTLR